MPTYEYACEKCGHEFEREQRITEDPVKTCPECRARKVRRLISNTSFVLKGSGWYSDLYSSQKPDKGSGSGDGDGDKASGDAKDKTEKKESGGKSGDKSEGKSKAKGKKKAAKKASG